MKSRRIEPHLGSLAAVLESARSKSVTHRALVAGALADGETRVSNPLDADDTRATLSGLQALGFDVAAAPGLWTIRGREGRVQGGGALSLGESGTTFRFLLALAALGARPSSLDGARRLRRRPIEPLAQALRELGASANIPRDDAEDPIVCGGSEVRGGRVRLPGGTSSQFASALLLVGSRLPHGLELMVEPPAVSRPYLDVTVRVLEQFGVAIERPGELQWTVSPQSYGGIDFCVEGDHSSASYFLAAAAIVGGRVRVRGLDPESAQADACFGGILRELGCQVSTGEDWIEVVGDGKVRPFDVDLSDAPDLGPTMAVLGLFAEGPATLRGVSHLRHKESDRLQVLADNLVRLGRGARASGDRLEIARPDGPIRGGRIATASDHRIAMAFAVAGLRVDGVVLDDADCVNKSNPEFWEQFEAL